MKPFRQGQLDGACGFYAIVNALRLVDPGRVPPQEAEGIVRDLLRATSHERFHDGTDRRDLHRMISRLLDERGWTDVEPRWPFWSTVPDLATFWATLEDHFARPGTAAILGFRNDGEPYGHWTVVRSVNPRALELFDSLGATRLLRERCRTRGERNKRRPHKLLAASTLLLQRVDA